MGAHETCRRVCSKTVDLVPMTLGFVTERYRGWLSDSVVNAYLSTRDVSMDDLREYVNKRIADRNVFFWAICDKASGAHIGNVKIEPIDWDSKSGVFGMLLGDQAFWGKGIGTEVTSAVVATLFDDYDFKSIVLGVEILNEAAIRVYEKAGFKIVETEHYRQPAMNGSLGKHTMEISRDDYAAQKNKLL